MDFYERNKIARPVPNQRSRSELLDGRSREIILRNVFMWMREKREWRGKPLCAWVGAVTGHGSGYSAQICREMGWDPDMPITPKSHLPYRETTGDGSFGSPTPGATKNANG